MASIGRQVRPRLRKGNPPKFEVSGWPENSRGDVLDLQKLETFRVLATTCNFTRAAVVLGYCQASVTMHIKGLERYFGVRLFERFRFSKDVQLTNAGRRTLEYTDRLLSLASEVRRAVQQADREQSAAAG